MAILIMEQMTHEGAGKNPLLTIGNVAEHCQVSEKTVRRWIKRGELVAYRLGRQWRIGRDDLEKFLKLRRQP